MKQQMRGWIAMGDDVWGKNLRLVSCHHEVHGKEDQLSTHKQRGISQVEEHLGNER